MIESEKVEKISNELKEYIDVNYELLKLQTIEKTSNFGAELLTSFYLGIIGFLTLIFTSFWMVNCISDYFEHEYLGFVVVSGFYSFLFIIFSLYKKALLFHPLRNKIIGRLTKKM